MSATFERKRFNKQFVTNSDAVLSPFRAAANRHRQGSVRKGGPFSFERRPTRFQTGEIRRRQRILSRFMELTAAGASQLKAAKQLRVGNVSIWRWRKRIAPLTERCGRKPAAAKFKIGNAMLEWIEALQLSGMGNAAAWRAVGNDPQCDPALAEFLRSAKSIPPSFLALSKITKTKAVVLSGRHFTHIRTE